MLISFLYLSFVHSCNFLCFCFTFLACKPYVWSNCVDKNRKVELRAAPTQLSHMNVRRRPLTILNVRPFLMAFVWDSLSRLETMDLSHFRCTPVSGHCFAPHFCLSEGAIAPQKAHVFLAYQFAEFSNCFAREPISSIEIDVGAVRVKVSYWQDSIPLSSRLCPSFFVSFASSQASRVFRLVYRPYRSFRFVFSSLVVSTSFVSFASRFVLCLTFSFFVLLFPSTYFFKINNCLFSTSSFRPVRCYSQRMLVLTLRI